MRTKINGHLKTSTQAWVNQARRERKSMVFTGSSLTVVGCEVRVELDEATRTGAIRFTRAPGRGLLSQIEVDAVMVDAGMLRSRMLRTLGIMWRIEPLDKADVR